MSAFRIKHIKRLGYIQLMNAYAPAFGFGGPVRLMYEYAQWMMKFGSNVTVLAGDTHHNYTRILKKQEMLNGIRIIRVSVYWRYLVRKNINFISPKMLIVSAWKIFQSQNRVIVHISVFRGLVPVYSLILKKLFPRKVILVHSAFGMLHFKQSRRRKLYDRLFMRPLLCAMDLGLAQNKHEISQYRDFFTRHKVNGNNKVVLFPLCAETRNYGDAKIGEYRSLLRTKYGIPDDAFVCIFLGRFHPAKGIIRAIDAFLAFSDAYSGRAFFLIVGRDDGMQQRITDYIHDHNAVSSIRIVNDVYETRFEYYTLADLFLGFPTIDEETMLASVEALSIGTPILVSREADIPFVQEEDAGFVIDFSIVTAVERMQRIADNPSLYRQQACKVAKKYFSTESASHSLITLFNRISQKLPADIT